MSDCVLFAVSLHTPDYSTPHCKSRPIYSVFIQTLSIPSPTPVLLLIIDHHCRLDNILLPTVSERDDGGAQIPSRARGRINSP